MFNVSRFVDCIIVCRKKKHNYKTVAINDKFEPIVTVWETDNPRRDCKNRNIGYTKRTRCLYNRLEMDQQMLLSFHNSSINHWIQRKACFLLSQSYMKVTLAHSNWSLFSSLSLIKINLVVTMEFASTVAEISVGSSWLMADIVF